MINPSIEQVVNAVLYEGYILYPYRASSPKNQRERFTFGRVYPAAYSDAQKGVDPCQMQTQVLVKTPQDNSTGVKISVRFLQPIRREIGALCSPVDGNEKKFKTVPAIEVDGQLFQSWHEAIEREIVVPPLTTTGDVAQSRDLDFEFPASRSEEPIHAKSGDVLGVIVRHREAIQGKVEVVIEPQPNCTKFTVRFVNRTQMDSTELADQIAVIDKTFASVHIVLSIDEGEFISLLEPPEEFRQLAKECRNVGLWPVLVGDEKSLDRRNMLASPIILYDWPKIAPESPGQLFDGTEIDEILNLRILAMTDEEKREMRNVDSAARRLLERTENLRGEDFLKMHGTLRGVRPLEEQIFGSGHRLEGINLGDVYVKRGDRVRIRPKTRADIMDIALEGKVAIIEALEEDAEARVHLALVVQDDPGKDLGMLRQPGHRFFYTADEVEPVKEDA